MRHLLGAGAEEPLAAYTGAGVSNRAFPIADERGSIIAPTDNAGAVTQVKTYDKYGVPKSTNAGRFQYT